MRYLQLKVKFRFAKITDMKKNLSRIFYFVSTILVAAFVIKSIVDYSHYSNTLNSAPFYVWVMVNALYFIIPAIVVFVVGIVMRKKQ